MFFATPRLRRNSPNLRNPSNASLTISRDHQSPMQSSALATGHSLPFRLVRLISNPSCIMQPCRLTRQSRLHYATSTSFDVCLYYTKRHESLLCKKLVAAFLRSTLEELRNASPVFRSRALSSCYSLSPAAGTFHQAWCLYKL
jgi:hypothetical protein